MLRFSRKTDYALVIVAALARASRREHSADFHSVRALARELRLPYRFASHIVGLLARAGILESREGLHGGYRLRKDPSAIRLDEVLRATESPEALVACLDSARGFACPQKAVCPVHRGMPAVQRLILNALARHTVADLLNASLS